MLDISNVWASRCVLIATSVTTAWYILCVILVVHDHYLDTLAPRRKADNSNRTSKGPVRTSAISGFLAIATAFIFPFIKTKEVQEEGGVLVLLLAQASVLGYLDLESGWELSGKAWDVAGVVLTAVLTLEAAEHYKEHGWPHNPEMYTYSAMAFEGFIGAIVLIKLGHDPRLSWNKSPRGQLVNWIVCVTNTVYTIWGIVLALNIVIIDGKLKLGDDKLPSAGILVGIAALYIGFLLGMVSLPNCVPGPMEDSQVATDIV